MSVIKFSQLQLLNSPPGSTIVPVVYNGQNYKITLDAIKGSVSLNWADIQGKPSFNEVAFSGDYTQLVNKPTIPTVPTLVSALTNDKGYITVSALAGYATQNWVQSQNYGSGGISTATVTALIASSLTNFHSSNSNGNVIQSATAPIANTSTLWYDTVGGRSYVYYDSNWVDASPATAIDLSTVTQHILPGADITYDLGSPSNRFRHLYVGPGSITIGNSVVTSAADGSLLVPGLSIPSSYQAKEVGGTYPDNTHSWSSPPLLIDNGYMLILRNITSAPAGYSPASYTASLDTNGYITGVTVDYPGSNWTTIVGGGTLWGYTGSDSNPITNFNFLDWQQTLSSVSSIASGILPPSYITDSLSSSTVAVQVGGTVSITAWQNTPGDYYKTWNFQANGGTGYITFPDGSVQSTAYTGSAGSSISNGSYSVSLGVDGYLNLVNGLDGAGALIQSSSPIRVNSNSYFWSFGNNGRLTLPISDQGVSSIEAPSGIWWTANGKSLQLSSNGAVDFPLVNGTTGLIRTSGNLTLNANSKEWLFNSSGSLTWPNSSVQTGASISIAELKTIITTCTSFTEFKNAILGL